MRSEAADMLEHLEDVEMNDSADRRQEVRVSNQYHFMTDVRMQESPVKTTSIEQ